MISARRLSIQLLVLASTLPSLAAGSLLLAGQPPFLGKRCDEEQARAPFVRGMYHYPNKCELVIPALQEAVQQCPEPEGPLSFRTKGFLTRPYLPYYFLGDCHSTLKDAPNALRHFYLSSCVDEPARDKEKMMANLGEKTRQCRAQLKSEDRPDLFPYFQEGFKAVKDREWKKAAEKMWNTMLVWPEDVKTTNSYGRWRDPYLPRFRLAEALLELGCVQEACAQLDKSKLKQARGEEKELQLEISRLKELEAQCATKKAKRSEDSMCLQWQCWLRQGGS